MADAYPGLRIVYLDDNELQLHAVRTALSRAGHHCITSTSLARLRAEDVSAADIVIVDFHMPEQNGEEALHLLRMRLPHDHRVLFYLYTSDRNVAVGFREAGFDGAFTSKGDTESLVGQVDAAARIVRLKRFRRQRGAT